MTHHEETKIDVAAYDIQGFCDAHNISRSMYYKLAKIGKAPHEMVVGKRKLISKESAAKWRSAMEAA